MMSQSCIAPVETIQANPVVVDEALYDDRVNRRAFDLGAEKSKSDSQEHIDLLAEDAASMFAQLHTSEPEALDFDEPAANSSYSLS